MDVATMPLSPLAVDLGAGAQLGASKQLGTNPGQSEVEAVGKELESVFLSMMLKEMRNSLEDGLFGSEGSDTYGGMFDLFVGKHIAESKPLGISDMLLEQYKKSAHLMESAVSETTPSQSGTSFTA